MGSSNEEKRITKQYLFDLITQYKLTKKEFENAREEKALWEKRIILAENSVKPDLAAAAQTKLQDCEASLLSLESHLGEISSEIRRARSDLKILDADPDLSIDPDSLLESLESMGGTVDPVKVELEETETDAALDQLKKEMGLS